MKFRLSIFSPRVLFVFSLYVPAITNFMLLPLIVAKLNFEGFGSLSYYLAVTAILSAIAGLGLPEASVVHSGLWAGRSKTENPIPLINLLTFCSSLFWFLGTYGLLEVFTPSEFRDQGSYLASSLIVSVTSTSNVLRSVTTGLHLFGTVAIERSLSSFTKLITILVLFQGNFMGVISVLQAQVLSTTVSLIFLSIVILKKVGLRNSLSFRKKDSLGSIVKYAMAQAPSSILGPLLSRLDQFLLARISGSGELGVYATSVSGSEGLTLSTSGYRDLTSAQQASALDQKKIRDNSGHVLLVSALVFIVSMLGIAVCWNLIEKYPVTSIMVPFFILLFSNVIGAPGSIAGAVLMGRKKPYLRSLSLLVALVLDVGLLIALAPLYGATGAAIATAISGLTAGFMNIAFCIKSFGISWESFYPIRRLNESIR